MPKLFLSIIVPAHNEANYIENTLEHLKKLDYPAERFEVIVVENGSSDDTLALAKKFEGGNLKVLQSAKGVSRAKNLGIDNLSRQSDWVVFLDADTVLLPLFLNELNEFLRKKGRGFTVGTVSVRPDLGTLQARLWFRFYDLGHALTKTSYSIQVVRRDLFPSVRFNETLVMGEDIEVARAARTFGKFFFMWTKSVLTSTRRFETLGWWYLLFYWTVVAPLPENWKRGFNYEVVR